jgi:hypothetical protein
MCASDRVHEIVHIPVWSEVLVQCSFEQLQDITITLVLVLMDLVKCLKLIVM